MSSSSTTSSIITNDWNSTGEPTPKPAAINLILKINLTSSPSPSDDQVSIREHTPDDELKRWGWWQGYRENRTLLGFDDGDGGKNAGPVKKRPMRRSRRQLSS